MRQLKQFMRSKKTMRNCGECKCITLQCWRDADEFCGCGDVTTEDMDAYALNWFMSTPVYADLDNAGKEEALANATTIIEGAGDGIAPFYNAVKSGKTFFDFINRNGLAVDESGSCDSSLVESDSAFVIYISAVGAIHCKYLAVDGGGDLVNAEEIAAYLDWLTTSDVTYTFKDWDGTVLKIGTVEKGTSPEAPSDPTRDGYTFIGWSPAVTAISRDTVYTAQYQLTQYTVTIDTNDASYGSVDISSVSASSGTSIRTSLAQLGIGAFPDTTVVTATSNNGYKFVSWTDSGGEALPETITGNLSVLANFEALPPMLEYSELVQLTPDQIVTELNKYPQDYATKYDSEDHIYVAMYWDDFAYQLMQSATQGTATTIDDYIFKAYYVEDGIEWRKVAVNP